MPVDRRSQDQDAALSHRIVLDLLEDTRQTIAAFAKITTDILNVLKLSEDLQTQRDRIGRVEKDLEALRIRVDHLYDRVGRSDAASEAEAAELAAKISTNHQLATTSLDRIAELIRQTKDASEARLLATARDLESKIATTRELESRLTKTEVTSAGEVGGSRALTQVKSHLVRYVLAGLIGAGATGFVYFVFRLLQWGAAR